MVSANAIIPRLRLSDDECEIRTSKSISIICFTFSAHKIERLCNFISFPGNSLTHTYVCSKLVMVKICRLKINKYSCELCCESSIQLDKFSWRLKCVCKQNFTTVQELCQDWIMNYNNPINTKKKSSMMTPLIDI